MMIRKIIAFFTLLVVLIGGTIFWSYDDAIFKFPTADKVVVLTYDDGPNPPDTQAILDVLEQYQVKATFFLKGRNVEAYPEVVKAVAKAGHEIGNHSYYHRPMIALAKGSIREEIERTNRLIVGALGSSPVLFRPPYGAQGPGLKLALKELGMKSVIMSDNGADWEVDDPELIASAILKTVEPGSIILLHDGHGDVDNPESQNSRAPTARATAIIIESLKSRGYRFATVGELMGEAGI
ncbi:MAG: polysaccharide deacetylase family protein [Halioglobus sp.]